MRPPRNASTATSLAADRIAGAVPPGAPGLVGERQARERLEVGDLEVERAERRPVDRAVRLGQPVRARRARARSAAACRASTAARSSRRRRTRPCCARPTAGARRRRCGRSRRRTARAPRSPRGPCSSASSCRRDLGAHGPRRVRERVGDRDVVQLGARCGRGTVRRSRSARCGATSDARPGAQALPDRGVLGVDGDDLAAARGARLGDDRARPRSGSPCSRARAACRLRSAASVAGSPAKPTTALSTTSASGSAASSASTSGSSAHARARSAGTPNSAACSREQLGVAAGGERDDAVLVAVVRQHVERLRPDRSGRSEDGDAARHAREVRGRDRRQAGRRAAGRRLRPISGRRRGSRRSAGRTAAPSKRSRTPP